MGKSAQEQQNEDIQKQLVAKLQADAAERARRPEDIKYAGVTDEQGNLIDKYKTQMTGDKYAGIAGEALDRNTAAARGTAAAGQAGAEANARAALATRGGLQGGMASRLAQTGAQQQMLGQQNITSDMLKGKGDIQQKAFDVNAGAEKANLDLLTGDVANKQNFAQDQYKTKMAAWASENLSQSQKANATPAGKK